MGVEVETLVPGTGKTFPQKGNSLEVHDGLGKPLSFEVGSEPRQVIQGWDEGMLQVSLGEQARLRISADYAYGEKGYGDGSKIPPNADLVFEVELVSINGKACADLERFEAELEKWVTTKLDSYASDAKAKDKYSSREKYEEHLRKKTAKQLRHI